MRELFIYIIVALSIISAATATTIVTNFSNGLSSGNLTFGGAGSQYLNISLPYWASITGATLNLAGYAYGINNTPIINKQSYGVEFNFEYGYITNESFTTYSPTAIYYGNDTNFSTYFVMKTNGSLGNIFQVTISSNFTPDIPLPNIRNLFYIFGERFVSASSSSGSSVDSKVYCMNKTGDFILIEEKSVGGNGQDIPYTNQSIVMPDTCINGTIAMKNIYDIKGAGAGAGQFSYAEFYEGQIISSNISYPSNITIRTNNQITYQNYSSSYNFSGIVSNIDLNKTLLQDCINDANATHGNVNCTINLTSMTMGRLEYSNLKIDHQYLIDNCSNYTTSLLNYTLYDEDNLSIISNQSEYIKVDIDIYEKGESIPMLEYSKKFGSNKASVCISAKLLEAESYLMDVTSEFKADGHVQEFDYIQNYTLNATSSLPIETSLYDLSESESQSFIITYKDNTFLPVSEAIIEILRFYPDLGEYLVVEDAKTDDQGQTTAHLVEEDRIYHFVVKKNAETLATFDDMQAICQSAPCQINLNQFESISTTFRQSDNLDYSFDIFNKTQRKIRLVFSIPDSSSADLNLTVLINDNWGNRTACTDIITASSGYLNCTIPQSFGNMTVRAVLRKDGKFITDRYFSMDLKGFDIFGYTGYFMAAIMYITLPFMAIATPTGALIFACIGLVGASGLGLVSASKLFALGSAMLWFVIAAAIVWYKMAGSE